ncbi:segmentation protein cap'n'collar isoform X2 [Copidosoma floridanum]|uniref:segmentation protein cap'n'collar isoform X2 n=1 Tax=Copidosoma floridanum TaxID=29053 RepID=UPI000C6FAECD|nr:segmentation protein cap'n'collar isoform X2 [Copidosoma floridanum]
MLSLKKFYGDELLQLALLLSLLRVDPDSYLGLDIQTIRVGSLGLNSGSGWHTDARTIVHRPVYVHPKNLDSLLLSYERDLFEDLNALGRYNRINSAHNDIHAYLLNVNDKAGTSTEATIDDAGNDTSPNPPQTTQTPLLDADPQLSPASSVELTQEDMDLIEVLWKQDVDLGFTLVDPVVPAKSAATSSKKESEDDIEKLKALEAINASNDQLKEAKEVKEEPHKDDDPWAGLQYTIDLETGEYIICAGSSGCSSASPESSPEQGEAANEAERKKRRSKKSHDKPAGAEEEEEDQQLLTAAEASLSELVGFGGEDSLDLGLEDDFAAELLLGDGCLLDDDYPPVNAFLGNDSLGLPDGFNLEEALQLVGLDEAQLEKKQLDVKKKKKKSRRKKRRRRRGSGAGEDPRASTGEDDEDYESGSSVATNMLHHQHPTQYHHAHHSHPHRFQSRMSPFMRSDISPFFMAGAGSEHYTHPGHHHYYHPNHFSYPSHHEAAAVAAAAAASGATPPGVLLNNATLPPPVGDNCTGSTSYHNHAGPANLGLAVATSMHLTNSSEPMGAGSSTAIDYKTEPSDINYYANSSVDTMNQSESFFTTFIDEQLWSEDLAFNVSDGAYGSAGSSAGAVGASNGATGLPVGGVHQGAEPVVGVNGLGSTGAGPMVQSTVVAATTTAAAATAATTVPGPTAGATGSLLGATDERMDASSDSAVSSMGSERVPSLSDEWMETGSNSSHTQADSHYAMDYAAAAAAAAASSSGKYRLPYDCGYSHQPSSGRHSVQRSSCHQTVAAADRGGLVPVAQKKHHMFGKRCFQEQGPMSGSPTGTAAATLKYDYEAGQGAVAAGPPGLAYSGPIEGASGLQSEIKYSCSIDFARHQPSVRSGLEHVQHNHTYHMPPESSGSLQRPVSRDKKGRSSGSKSEADEHLTRDEKRARALNVPIAVNDIINLPMDEFNERLSKYDLSEAQLSLIRDIRRRGKNKVAAQNCRKRKLDQINCLSDEVKEMRTRKMRLLSERSYIDQELRRVHDKYSRLYKHIVDELTRRNGPQYSSGITLQQTADGNIIVLERSTQGDGHYMPVRLDHQPRTGAKPENQTALQPQHHHHHQNHHQHNHHHHHHQEHKE